jgi:hypothetical protein
MDKQIRDELSGDLIELSKEGSFMFDYIDSFVALSRENTSVETVTLYAFDSNAGDYVFWDKVGQIVGNLRELKTIVINFLPYDYDDDNDGGDEVRIVPTWETLARILPYVQRKISLFFPDEDLDAEVEDIQGLARAIDGHPMISEFTSEMEFTAENFAPWCSALSTLPFLEKIFFGLQEPETEDQRVLLDLEPFKKLLRTPALRFVTFKGFNFTNELCHATANALEVGSSITDITFGFGCSFCDGGRAIIAKAFKTNASVTNVLFGGYCDESLCDTVAAVLLCSSTLLKLTLCLLEEGAVGRWLCPIFLSLGMNYTLKSLSVSILNEFGDELGAAIRNGLAKNSTLEELSLHRIYSSDDDGAASARNALSFLRTNSTLKSLTVSFAQSQKASYISAFRLEAVKMVSENSFLDSLTITTGCNIEFEELLPLLSALQLNTTLKTLSFQSYCFYKKMHSTVDEASQLVSILMKNYGLERLTPDLPCAVHRIVKAILRLNAAGRRYLIKDGSSVSKGVEVLSAVSNEIDCVFLHLLENPSLCYRRATDTTPSRWRPGSNLDESSCTGLCR